MDGSHLDVERASESKRVWVLNVGPVPIISKPRPQKVARRGIELFRDLVMEIGLIGRCQELGDGMLNVSWEGVVEVGVVKFHCSVGAFEHGRSHTTAMLLTRTVRVTDVSKGDRDLSLLTVGKESIVCSVLFQFLLMFGL